MESISCIPCTILDHYHREIEGQDIKHHWQDRAHRILNQNVEITVEKIVERERHQIPIGL